jgi:nucleoside-diphosphate-sugar epimerase
MLIKKIGHVDHIIAMASLSDVHDSIVNPVPFVQQNVNIALAMLEYARVAKPERFLADLQRRGLRPDDGEHYHKEWDPIVPSNPYSASKAAQEAIAISYWRTYNVPLMIVNLMNNFGEMQSPSKFPAIVQRKLRAASRSPSTPAPVTSARATTSIRATVRTPSSTSSTSSAPHIHSRGPRWTSRIASTSSATQIGNVELVKLIADCIAAWCRTT